jgi:hypothetical protein
MAKYPTVQAKEKNKSPTLNKKEQAKMGKAGEQTKPAAVAKRKSAANSKNNALNKKAKSATAKKTPTENTTALLKTAAQAASTSPLDRPNTEAEWIQAQATDSHMMRQLRRLISGGLNPRLSFTTEGLMVYRSPNSTRNKVVVPEHLQAVTCYVHHNMELSAHQGAKRQPQGERRSIDSPTSSTPRPGHPNRHLGNSAGIRKRQCIPPKFMDTFLRWPGAISIPNRNTDTIAKLYMRKSSASSEW